MTHKQGRRKDFEEKKGKGRFYVLVALSNGARGLVKVSTMGYVCTRIRKLVIYAQLHRGSHYVSRFGNRKFTAECHVFVCVEVDVHTKISECNMCIITLAITSYIENRRITKTACSLTRLQSRLTYDIFQYYSSLYSELPLMLFQNLMSLVQGPGRSGLVILPVTGSKCQVFVLYLPATKTLHYVAAKSF